MLTRFHVEIWEADFEDSVSELYGADNKPYFKSLQDVKIKCENYVDNFPPEFFSYIFDCHGQLSIAQVGNFQINKMNSGGLI